MRVRRGGFRPGRLRICLRRADGKKEPPQAVHGKEKDIDDGDDDDARRIMEFLLDLDNYTAELLSEIMHGDVSSASDLARKMGVSRQAVHRKIVDCCTLHPELRKLFITRLYRCRRLLTDSKRLSKKKNQNQMEFDFDGVVQ